MTNPRPVPDEPPADDDFRPDHDSVVPALDDEPDPDELPQAPR